METSLTWLGRLAGDGGPDDWRHLADAYGPLLRGWLGRAAVPECDRDDLAQDVLLVVVRRVGEFEHRGPGAFRAWLRGIVANVARKYFRDRKSAAGVDLDELAATGSDLGRAWDREHDEYLAARAMRAAEPDFALATWRAFRLQVIDGRPAAEVAAELSLSVNAVLLAKSRVLRRLREALAGLLED